MNTDLFSAAWRGVKDFSTLSFRTADYRDAARIAAVVNTANAGAGGGGWTNEYRLFEGERTDVNEILEMISVPGAAFLLCLEHGQVVGSVYLKTIGRAGHMGLLAVLPELQARGIGKNLIAEAERMVRDEWRCSTMLLSVIASHRPELLAYYQRRGYVRTGRGKAFERKQVARKSMAATLRLEWMGKLLTRECQPQ